MCFRIRRIFKGKKKAKVLINHPNWDEPDSDSAYSDSLDEDYLLNVRF